MRLEGKVTIVAGGGPGIGEGVVKELAKEGADIAVIDISEAQAKRVAAEVEKLGRKSLAIAADLTNEEACNKAVQTTLDTFGKLDILVNVVGGVGSISLTSTAPPGFENLTEAQLDQVFTLNLTTHFLMCKAVTPTFKKQRHGKIVNMASTAGHRYHKMVLIYALAKRADIHFTKNLAYELAPYNINVNCVQPGSVYTPGFQEAATKRRIELNPKLKGKDPEELFLEGTLPRIL